ncbi:AraC family transcriptional regulator [Aequorivita sp. H23M31]|uniref:AraC family transcriptional regulator n=1 Tax=Aequorivita ciconiae TaxID=2494375 RepID=A0A410G122_9FLAO|nr:SRPBCC family protein [Aequorivita sp. H23M31]QAA80978.1 AraC family transcriptional regulator [Aequorivita sp. H23M31]
MKILKYLLFLILLIIIGSAIYFGTKDGDYAVSDSIVVAAPAEVVFDKVNDFKNWEGWMPFKQKDPSLTFKYAEKSSGEGASMSWEGKNSGSITTTKVIPYKEIQQDLTFKSAAGKRNAKMIWLFETIGDSTKVTWETNGKHTLMEKAYMSIKGSDFVSRIHTLNNLGLAAMASEVVTDMKKYNINVDGVTQYGGGYYMYTTSVAKKQEVLEKSAPMIELVKDFVSKNNLSSSGAPFILYNEADKMNNTVIFSTGIPISERVITPENSPVVCGFMEPVTALKITLKGNYENMPEALQKGMEDIRQNDLQVDPERKIFEIYSTDTSQEPNPAKWVSEIYIPIQPKEPPAGEVGL